MGTDKTKDDADDENEKDEGFEESAEADDPEDDNDEVRIEMLVSPMKEWKLIAFLFVCEMKFVALKFL